jgi:hypothetical protein
MGCFERPTRPVPRPRPHVVASSPRLLLAGLALAALAAGCATTPRAVTVPHQGTLAASHDREDWIVGKLRDMRAAEKTDGARAKAIRRELEQAGVDWDSFLALHGSVRGSCCLYGEWMKNHIFRQVTQKLNLVRDVRQIFGIPDRANDLAKDGRVLDSAFFTNRDVGSITPEQVREEAFGQAPHGTVYLTERKGEGVSEGFWGKDENDALFIFVLDPPGFDEMNTAAEVMGSTILRLAGYNVPYPAIVTLDSLALAPEVLAELAEERVEGEAPDTDVPTPKDVEQFQGRRAVATKAISSGYRGPWTMSVFRARREVRALAIFGAWINNYDQVDHNTIAQIFDKEHGLVRYYVVDTSSAFGSASNRVKSPSAGYVNNSIDLHRFFTTPLRALARPFGYRDPWDPDQPIVSPAIGRFDANLQPRLWKPQYPNLAYEDMDEEDARWAARIVGQFSDEMIDTIVGLAHYSRPEDADYMAKTLKARRDIIVETYLGDD